MPATAPVNVPASPWPAGVGQKKGENRLNLLQRNADIFKDIFSQIVPYNREAVFLIVTNPVDVLTYVAQEVTDLPQDRIIGSGTVLDTSRFRYLISEHCEINAHNVHGYVVGEHGDSEVPLWSLVTIGGAPFDSHCNVCPKRENCASVNKKRISEAVKNSAYHIIEYKGATYYAVSQAMLRIVKAVFRNENSILTVSSRLNGQYGLHDVCLSVPCVVNSNGRERILEIPMSEEEQRQLQHSAEVLKEAIRPLKL